MAGLHRGRLESGPGWEYGAGTGPKTSPRTEPRSCTGPVPGPVTTSNLKQQKQGPRTSPRTGPRTGLPGPVPGPFLEIHFSCVRACFQGLSLIPITSSCIPRPSPLQEAGTGGRGSADYVAEGVEAVATIECFAWLWPRSFLPFSAMTRNFLLVARRTTRPAHPQRRHRRGEIIRARTGRFDWLLGLSTCTCRVAIYTDQKLNHSTSGLGGRGRIALDRGLGTAHG